MYFIKNFYSITAVIKGNSQSNDNDPVFTQNNFEIPQWNLSETRNIKLYHRYDQTYYSLGAATSGWPGWTCDMSHILIYLARRANLPGGLYV